MSPRVLASSWSGVYESTWHNPGLFWLAIALFFAVLAVRIGGLAGFLVAFGLEILADCTLTGGLTPVASPSTAATTAGIVFVILGDLRYFWLVEAGAAGDGLRRHALPSLGLAVIVPVANAVAPRALPTVFASARITFLVYEVMMLALVAAHGVWRHRRPGLDARGPGGRRFVRALLGFELLQYGLWATADVLLLQGVDVAHLLRLVPNTMYYALFLPFVLLRSPRLEVPA